MQDETAMKMYESARDKLKELLRQETEIKEQISHWGPIVEQLARLLGETVDPDIASRINELKQNEASAGEDAMIKIQYYRSSISTPETHKQIVRSLGFTKLNQIVERTDTPATRGFVDKVPHLLRIIE